MFDQTLDAGEYDRRVTLQTPTNSRGAVGGNSATWATHAAVWAKVRALSGREVERAQSIAINPRMVIVRWRGDVTPDMRVLFDDGSIGRILWTQEMGYRDALAIAVEVVEG